MMARTRHRRILGDSTAEWLFPTGAYAYWRGQPVKAEYAYEAAAELRQ